MSSNVTVNRNGLTIISHFLCLEERCPLNKLLGWPWVSIFIVLTVWTLRLNRYQENLCITKFLKNTSSSCILHLLFSSDSKTRHTWGPRGEGRKSLWPSINHTLKNKAINKCWLAAERKIQTSNNGSALKHYCNLQRPNDWPDLGKQFMGKMKNDGHLILVLSWSKPRQTAKRKINLWKWAFSLQECLSLSSSIISN